ncbi:MAG: hypothetical protein LBH41_00415 [Rickettsiales bacterium]|nr:hypothetical protein [Rickettsiales bacterium]
MKEELLKSVSAPPRLFFAPFRLAALNFVAHITVIIAMLTLSAGGYIWISIISFLFVHAILAAIASAEPHIDNMIAVKSSFSARTKSTIPEKGDKFAA